MYISSHQTKNQKQNTQNKEMEYIKETINNYEIAHRALVYNGYVDLACVYCINIYTQTKKSLPIKQYNNTMICKTCDQACVIPITSVSKLVAECSDNVDRIDKLEQWHTQGFKEIEDDEYYSDFEYGEEMKDGCV